MTDRTETTLRTPLCFLDFEASSLDSGSYPIEVAWVDAEGHGETYLIQPHWSWHGWSAASEAIHHITQDMLRDATPASHVAERAQNMLTDRVVISDEPAFDQYWLEMLLKVIDAPPIKLHDIHALIGEEIKRVHTAITTKDQRHRQSRMLLDQAQIAAMRAYEGAKMKLQHQHRALPDAQEHWHCWKAVRVAIDDLLKSVSNEH
jgi:DNA polymerase III epsilon subunit-like protein